MSHLKILLCFLPLAITLHGCSTSDTDVDCGEGTARTVDGQTYCLYQSNLIIEGFECPNQMTPHEVPNGMVCSPNSDLPDDLIDPFDPMDPWCVANCDVITDPDPISNVQPTPTNASDFQRVYRQRDYACVIDKNNKALCWGPAFNGMLTARPQRFDNIEQLALGNFFICTLNTNQEIKCYGSDFASTFDPNQKYTAITSNEESVCALGGTNAPYNQLSCISTSGSPSAFANRYKSSSLPQTPFTQFSIKMAGESEFSNAGCGIDNSGDIRCLGGLGEFQFEGPYRDVQNKGDHFVCGIAQQGNVRCWNLSFPKTEIAAPQGTFVELYGPECGLLDTNKVVCWHDLEPDTPKDQILTLTTLFDEHPRAFDLHQTVDNDTPSGWCAIKLNGDLECSDF